MSINNGTLDKLTNGTAQHAYMTACNTHATHSNHFNPKATENEWNHGGTAQAVMHQTTLLSARL
jgi:hypothetical protein